MQTGFNSLTAEHVEYAENISLLHTFARILRFPRLLSFWLGSGLPNFGFRIFTGPSLSPDRAGSWFG